jgi:hypothetical protein
MNRGTTQKIFIALIVAVIAVGLLYFIYRTSRAYLSGPSITITEPSNYASFSTSTTTIVGIAKRAQDITLDGRSITIDNNGNFRETILLMPGYNIEIIAAHDQFRHTTEKRLELVYLAPQTIASTTIATST